MCTGVGRERCVTAHERAVLPHTRSAVLPHKRRAVLPHTGRRDVPFKLFFYIFRVSGAGTFSKEDFGRLNEGIQKFPKVANHSFIFFFYI